ncbi:hypothetical protein HMF8227_02690 [Saliniradius amylolyticus]|uniref:HTH tetR-type domain-containing protein n=1 Tax=Saliniradius amylolyticus TaxID=2183582 RepID=A0A2S2E6I5_9ALTE|nr:TetR/AcrR family transcriptional regulator [Saliniradius amylolyticus]AWL13142.1 hypothetical protein HMF8227_02690 [Saliniradius amylolyticus]
MGTQSETRQATLLKVATQLFIEQGYQKTSLEQVIQRAGGSRRNVYSAFGNKAGLFKAAVQQAQKDIFTSAYPENWDQGDPETVLRQLGIGLISALTSRKTLALFREVIAHTPSMPSLGEDLYQSGPKRVLALLAGYLQKQVDDGKLDIKDCQKMAKQLIEVMRGDLHLRALLCPDQPIRQQEIEDQVDLAIDFLRKHYQ